MYFIAFILKNLTRRPVRTALTIIGLTVALGSTIALLGISESVSRAVNTSFERRGIDIIVTAAGKTDQLSSDFSETLVEEASKIPGVQDAEAAIVELIELTRDSGSSVPVLIQGWPAKSFGYEDLALLSGRRLSAGDHGKAMLGTTLTENLDKKVGDTIIIQGERFEVVGIYKSFVVFENGSATLLLDDVQRMMGRVGRVTGFTVRVAKSSPDSTAEVEAVREKIAALHDPKDPTVRLAAQTTRTYVDTVAHLRMVRGMTWMVSMIALMIGVFSMLNTMVMSVFERTQEIGILRAVGWSRGRIISMILGEAVLLGLAAAALGTVGAIAVTYLLTLSPKANGFIEGGVAPVVIAQGVGLAVLIALVGGAYPAFRAANLLPTEALRHD